MGSVGHEVCRFSAADWNMLVEYSPAGPDRTVYLALLESASTGFVWRGQVDAEGTVLQFRD
jgi:hypothetical protein